LEIGLVGRFCAQRRPTLAARLEIGLVGRFCARRRPTPTLFLGLRRRRHWKSADADAFP